MWDGLKSTGAACVAVLNWITSSDLRRRADECDKDRAQLRKENAQNRADIRDLQVELETLRDLTMIGALTIDRYGRITDATSEIVAMTGYPLETLLRMRLRDLLPSQTRNQHDVWVKELGDGKRPIRSTLVEGEFRCSEGSAVPVMVKIMEFHSDSGMKFRADIRRR